MADMVMIAGMAVPVKGLGLKEYRDAFSSLAIREIIGGEYQKYGLVFQSNTIVARWKQGVLGCSSCKLLTTDQARDVCVQSLGKDWNGLCAYQ